MCLRHTLSGCSQHNERNDHRFPTSVVLLPTIPLHVAIRRGACTLADHASNQCNDHTTQTTRHHDRPQPPLVHAPAAPLTTSETEEACRAMRARGQGSTSRKPGAEGSKDSRCNASALSPSLVLYMAIISNIAKTRCGLLTSPDPVPARFGSLFVRRCVRRTCNLAICTRDCK